MLPKLKPLGGADFLISFLLFFALFSALIWLDVDRFGWRDALFAAALVLVFLAFVFSLGRARRAQTAPWKLPAGRKGFALKYVLFFCVFLLVRLIPIADNYLFHGVKTFNRDILFFCAWMAFVFTVFTPWFNRHRFARAEKSPLKP